MSTTDPTAPPHVTSTDGPVRQRHSEAEELADAAVGLGLVARTGEIALAAIVALLVCPPLAILAVAVIVPAVIVAALIALVYAVCAAPILLVRRVREHHRTHRSSAVVHGLRALRARAA